MAREQVSKIPWERSSAFSFRGLVREMRQLDEALGRNRRLSKPEHSDWPRAWRQIWLSPKMSEVDEHRRQKILLQAQRPVGSKQDFELSPQGLMEVHHRVLGPQSESLLRSQPGRILTSSGRNRHTLPSPQELGACFEGLREWDRRYRRRHVLDAFHLHLLLLLIHPFMDGNGRLARECEATLLRAQGFHLPWPWHPEVVVHVDFGGYSRAIATCRREQSSDAFLSYMLRGYVTLGERLLFEARQ